MFVGWSFVLLKETHRRSTRRRKKSSRPTTENTQTSLRFRVLNLRALISSRARFSLFREALLSRRRTEEKKKRKEEQIDTETTVVRKKKTKKKRGKEERETTRHHHRHRFRATFGHQKRSLHFEFRVLKVDSKLLA